MNEILFLSFALTLFTINLIAFRLGKIYIFVLIAVYTLLMNIFVTKQFELFGLLITGGNALYGAVFLLTDLLSEHFGKREAYKAVLTGFFVSSIFVVATQILIAFTPSSDDFAHESIQTLFTITPRILLGSMFAYFIAQTIDVWLFTQIKKWTKSKYLWLRNNGSTLISQAIDTVIFTAVGLTAFNFIPFGGLIPVQIFWEVCLATYLIKILVAFIDTPFIYLSYKFLPAEIKKTQKSMLNSLKFWK